MTEDHFQRAIQLHQQGNLRDAEIAYRRCLQENPVHADALHLLGVIAHQFGHHHDAAELIQQAIAINPAFAAYYANLAEAYRGLGHFQQALAACRQALQADPHYAEAHNNMGLVRLRLKEFSAAETAFRQALAEKPNLAAAANNLGHALREQQRNAEALQAYRQAVSINPDMAEVHNNLGQLLLEEEQLDEALLHCGEAVRLAALLPEAHSNLGNVLRARGQLEAAKACYHEALRLNPRIGMAHNNLGQALQEQGHIEQAIRCYDEALGLEPQTPRFHNNLASALAEQESFESAVEHYRTAIALEPAPESWCGLGCVYRDCEQFCASAAAFREAIRLDPDWAPAHEGLGQTLIEIGELDASYASFRRAIECDSQLAGPWCSLASHHRRHFSPDDCRHLESLLAKPWLKPASAAAIHFALAHFFDSLREYDRAAQQAHEANRFQREARLLRGEVYDPADHEALVDQVINIFNAEWFRALSGNVAGTGRGGFDTELPVFIIGMPRSGTTLTEQILASHPDVHGAGELRVARLSFESVSGGAEMPCASAFQGLASGQASTAARDYVEQLRSRSPESLRIVDKMPENYLYLGWLTAMFPQARIIHCRRDPCATALSCWLTNFRSIRWANDPAHITHRARQYERLIEHWRSAMPVNMFELDYETLVADLAGVARQLTDWLGLPWDERCVAFHNTSRPVRTASVSQVRQPVYATSIGRWRNYETLIPKLFAELQREPQQAAKNSI